MKYEDIVPQAAPFKLRTLPEVALTLRPFDLDDEFWLKENYADIQAVFEKVDMKAITQIVWHQLDTDSRKWFAQKEIEVVNDEGQSTVHKVGGLKAFRAYIQGNEDKITLMKALLQTLGISRPMLEKMEAEAEKKSQEVLSQTNPTGRSFLTYSQASTDGQAAKSESSP